MQRYSDAAIYRYHSDIAAMQRFSDTAIQRGGREGRRGVGAPHIPTSLSKMLNEGDSTYNRTINAWGTRDKRLP